MHMPRLHAFALTSVITLAGIACSAAPEQEEDATNTQAFTACEDGFELDITAPNPAYAWTPNAVTLMSEELSSGVFAIYDQNAASVTKDGIPAATSGGFVIGDDGVLLVETMINRQLFCQTIDLVRAQTDLPVLYAVNTSHHGDHSYGNAFLPDDVQVVQHRGTVDFITDPDAFAGDIAFMKANFGADQGIDESSAVTADVIVDDEGWSVDLGNRPVEVLHIGFGQTDGDLFVHVPDANVLWSGNPIVARAPALPWLLDGHAREVRETLASLETLFPGATLIPGHDTAIAVSDTDFAVRYLDALIASVQASIDAGMTLDEAVAAATLLDYQGYALWGWVHAVVNVPATYVELSE